ncbi:MAG TPA: hypothetical protein VK578_09625 [Edaphobacter sp.]|jgi:hypothetical protein|nr:hypothetical protein [Edaphobacter sp.]
MFKFFRATALLSFAASLLLPFATTTAHAQKPALVKDTDALGRSAYQQTVLFVQNNSTCTSFYCLVSFKPVPAGYRLVITHVSGRFKLGNGNAGGTVAGVTVTSDGESFGDGLSLPAPIYVGFSSYTASSPVTYYVEAGKTPEVLFEGQFVTTDGSYTATATVVGYLISLP